MAAEKRSKRELRREKPQEYRRLVRELKRERQRKDKKGSFARIARIERELHKETYEELADE